MDTNHTPETNEVIYPQAPTDLSTLKMVELHPGRLIIHLILIGVILMILVPIGMWDFLLLLFVITQGNLNEGDKHVLVGFAFLLSLITCPALLLLPTIFFPTYRSSILGIHSLRINAQGFTMFRRGRKIQAPWTEFLHLERDGAVVIHFKPPLKPFKFFMLNTVKERQLNHYIQVASHCGWMQSARPTLARQTHSAEQPVAQSLIIKRKRAFSIALNLLVVMILIPIPLLISIVVAINSKEMVMVIPTFLLCFIIAGLPAIILHSAFNSKKCYQLRTDENGIHFYDKTDLMLHCAWEELVDANYRLLTLVCKVRLMNGKTKKVKFPLCTNDEAEKFISEWSLMTQQHKLD